MHNFCGPVVERGETLIKILWFSLHFVILYHLKVHEVLKHFMKLSVHFVMPLRKFGFVQTIYCANDNCRLLHGKIFTWSQWSSMIIPQIRFTRCNQNLCQSLSSFSDDFVDHTRTEMCWQIWGWELLMCNNFNCLNLSLILQKSRKSPLTPPCVMNISSN